MRHTLALAIGLLLLCGPVEAKNDWKPGKVLALKSAKHDRAFSLYIPSKYSSKKSWPLVLSSHGRGGAGNKEIRGWQALANKHGFIVACPDMVTATNHRPKTSSLPAEQEDDEVLMSIYDAITEQLRVNKRAVMITGFSGGGNPSYHTGLRHPDRITHICTRGGNFSPQQVPRDKRTIDAGKSSTSIYIFYGEKDHPLIVGENGQNGAAKNAYEALTKAGYENVVIEEVPGMKHESRPGTAAAWFGAWVAENEKMFKAGDKADGVIAKADAAQAKKKLPDVIKHLKKAHDIQAKAGLPLSAKARLDAIEAEGKTAFDALKEMGDGGAVEAALKGLRSLAKEYRGLPIAKEAATLIKAFKAK